MSFVMLGLGFGATPAPPAPLLPDVFTPSELGALRWWSAKDAASVGAGASTWTDQIAGQVLTLSGTGVTHDALNGIMIGNGSGYFYTNTVPFSSVPFTVVTVGRFDDTDSGTSINMVCLGNSSSNNHNFLTELSSTSNNGAYKARMFARDNASAPTAAETPIAVDSDLEGRYSAVYRFAGTSSRSAVFNRKDYAFASNAVTPTGINRFAIGANLRTSATIGKFRIEHVVLFEGAPSELIIEALLDGLEERTPKKTYMRDYFANNGLTAPWYIITHPNAIKSAGKLTIGYETWSGSSRVQSVNQYDYATDRWYPDSFPMITREPLSNNDHGNPSELQHSNGHLFAFGNMHSNFSDSQFSSTKYPNDITNWIAQPEYAPNGLTYPNPHERPNGDILMFARAATTGYPLHALPIAISGGTMTHGTDYIIANFGTDRCYISGSLRIGDEVYIPCTRADNGDSYRKNVYLFIYDLVTDTVRNIESTVSYNMGSFPISNADVEAYFKVVDMGSEFTGPAIAYAVDIDGRLHLGYVQGATAEGTTFTGKHVFYDGVTWSSPGNIGVTTKQRYDSIAFIRNSEGYIDFKGITLEPGNEFERGGVVSGNSWTPGGGWTSLEQIAPIGPVYPFDYTKSVLGGEDESLAIWAETAVVGLTAKFSGGAGGTDRTAGNLRCYAHGDNGYIRRRYSTTSRTDDLIDRMTVKPDLDRIIMYDEFIRGMLSMGIFRRMDAVYLLTAHNEQAAKLNIIQDAYNLTNYNGVSFAADYGFTGNGINGYLGTGYNPSTVTNGWFGQVGTGRENIGVYNLSEGQSNAPEFGTVYGGSGSRSFITARNTSDMVEATVNTAAVGVISEANTSALGHFVASRIGSPSEIRSVAINAEFVGQHLSDTWAKTAGELALLRHNNLYSTRRIGAAHFGAIPTDQCGNLRALYIRYLTGVGAI